ncbi:MAG: V-type ATP synthase subunit A [Candidatus Odinarchaeota archaeon]|nr:V-type ATP synthase subunit A [Candidatus Odinarchaeota archaeon]
MSEFGYISRINGSLVMAEDVPNAKVGDIVLLGELKLLGEIVRMKENLVAVQCYEDTSALRPGDPVENTNRPLVAELGPGLLGEIFDGLEYSETKILEFTKTPFIKRGVKIAQLDREKKWDFTPTVKKGDKVVGGDIIGTVPETVAIEHKVMVPPDLRGEIVDIYEGKFTVTDTIAVLKTPSGEEKELMMLQYWPVRRPRPYKERVPLVRPLFTGQRIIDTFFPIAKGGTGAIPGGFGTGKTVTLHQLAKWSDADVVVYIGCGERGNEMADVITHFPSLKDPRTGKTLSERSIFIANVSNLPVFAREASIYMGVTIGEYYRDMGYDVALMADSTSRWAEALRDISGRLEEIPAERGYPAYLAERLAEFYERGGRVYTLGQDERMGSLTLMGAVSPPGGDFSEPVTSTTIRFVGTLWALDKELAFQRHFPAINWLMSFSKYIDLLSQFWREYDPNWANYRTRALSILEEASKIEETAKVVGEKALPEDQRLILLESRILREGFLFQNAFHEEDTYCGPEKQVKMLRAMIEFYDLANKLIREGIPVEKVAKLKSVELLKRLREQKGVAVIDEAMNLAKKELSMLAKEYDLDITF